MPRFLLIPLALLLGLAVWVGATSLGISSSAPPSAIFPGDDAVPVRGAAPVRSIHTPLVAVWPIPAPMHQNSRAARPAGVAIVIPRLGLRATVIDEDMDPTGHLIIAHGPVITHFRFSATPGQSGNYIAYGHDDIEGSLFRYLPTMRWGDQVALVEGHRRYIYRVTGSRVVLPSDVSVLAQTRKPTITLISCTPYLVDTQRIVVTAALVAVIG